MGGAVGGVAAELADASFEAAISAENFIFGENEPTMQFVSSSMIIDPVILRLIIVCSAFLTLRRGILVADARALRDPEGLLERITS